MGDVPECVYACVCAPRPCDANLLLEQHGERFLQRLLHADLPLLPLPAVEVSAPV